MLNRRDIWWRARGLDRLDATFPEPSLLAILDAKLHASPPVNVLEIGCGEAHALLGLAWRYRGRAVELIGLNDAPTATMAKPADLRAAFVDFEICAPAEATRVRLPKLVFADAGRRLPFSDRQFDIIASGTTFHYVVDKARALEEVWRVLKVGGTALIHIDSFNPDMPDFMNTAGDTRLFMPRFVIYDASRARVSTAVHLKKLAREGFAIHLDPSPRNPAYTVVRLTRNTTTQLDLKLELDDTSTLPNMQEYFAFKEVINDDLWWGTRSVFRTRDDGKKRRRAPRASGRGSAHGLTVALADWPPDQRR